LIESYFPHVETHAPSWTSLIELRNHNRVLHVDRRQGIPMDANPNILVVLSDDLLNHFRKIAQEEQVPLRWLVAGMVCGTLEMGIEQTMRRQTVLSGTDL
jgi:hypothetical protein